MTDKIEKHGGKAAGGMARAKALSAEQRQEIAQKAAQKRWQTPAVKATHGDIDHPLRINDIAIPCYVLEDETRVLSQRGLQQGIGMSTGGGLKVGEQRIAVFLDALAEKGIQINDLAVRIRNPIKFMPPFGGNSAYGYPATILADICDVVLSARKEGKLSKQQEHLAERCEILVRGFARVGIIALVDEATGFQKDRQRDALAKILEAFIAKELQPYVPTFDADYYQEMFRLRGLNYPTDSVKRPLYFGTLTNNLIYKRLAPGVLAELKKVSPRNETGRHKDKLFQRLTMNRGYPKLRQHLGSVVAIMKLSDSWRDFMKKMDKIHPPYGTTLNLPFECEEDKDTGIGI